jgi:predicted dienelactone hydrolase
MQPTQLSTSSRPVDLQRRRFGSALLLAGTLPLLPRFARAQELTPAYREIDFDWVDSRRDRAVPARLYWPNAAGAGSVPLVVFSHGIGGSRRGYSYLGKHWASHGYASLHVQHVGSDSAVWGGNPLAMVSRLQAAAQESEAIARVKDLTFALDQVLELTPEVFSATIDRRRIVVAGHSYGANSTLLAIGARVERGDHWLAFRDPRFAAAVVISAPPFYGERNLAAVLGQVAVPTLHVTATEDVIQIPGYRSGAADRIAVFDAVADPRKTLVVYEGGSHSMFTDRAGTGGISLNPLVKTATKELALAFFGRTFDGDAQAMARWGDTWKAILAKPAALAVLSAQRG